MPNCRKCNIELTWPQPYEAGARPVNADGTNHDCGPITSKKGGESAPSPNAPDSALYGKDRCVACSYNRKKYCNPDDALGHFMKV